jgi:CubicO group peptidase (beta-lactamase class C family)
VDAGALDAYLAARTEAGRFSGVVAIDRGGEPWLRSAHGLASRAWGVPCTLDTRFDTASITKLFTAVAVLQQVEAGAFALDTGVVGYLGFEDTPISPAVTPYHLLTHTSGIGDDADEEAGERYEDLFLDRPSYRVRETADLLAQCTARPPNFAPGEGARYCNCGYVLLGLMVERATGRRYREVVAERVLAAAGMTRSGFFAMDVVEPGVAEGADPLLDGHGAVTGWRRNIYSYPPVGSPDGGAHVTADDLLRFRRALAGGELLGEELTAAMLAPHRASGPRGAGMHHYGLGFEHETDAAGRVRCSWKEGINPGVSGLLTHYPPADVTVVILSNLEDGAWEPAEHIDRELAAA